LHTGGALIESVAHALGVAVTASQPEWHTQRAQARYIHLVAFTVNRLADSVEQEFATRRRIVSTGCRAFDDQAIYTSAGPAQHGGGQCIGADDR